MAAVRRVAHELDLWSAEILEDGAINYSHQDVAARLATMARELVYAIERRSDEPDESVD
jgi:hypothetical protein